MIFPPLRAYRAARNSSWCWLCSGRICTSASTCSTRTHTTASTLPHLFVAVPQPARRPVKGTRERGPTSALHPDGPSGAPVILARPKLRALQLPGPLALPFQHPLPPESTFRGSAAKMSDFIVASKGFQQLEKPPTASHISGVVRTVWRRAFAASPVPAPNDKAHVQEARNRARPRGQDSALSDL